MDKRVIVITGSTRGIGFGLAKYFLGEGHRVVMNGRDQEQLESSLNLLKNKGEIIALAGDASLESTHLSLLKYAKESFGKVDIYINNAGIPQGHHPFVELEYGQIKNLIQVNIQGLMLGTKCAANFMLEQGFGKIFNMEGFGSDGRTLEKLTLYGSSKRAVNYFNKSMAKELKNSCIQIGSINPGMVNTDFIALSMKNASEDEIKNFEKIKRIMSEEVDTVVPFIGKRILQSQKNYDKINFLSGFKLFGKIVKMIIS